MLPVAKAICLLRTFVKQVSARTKAAFPARAWSPRPGAPSLQLPIPRCTELTRPRQALPDRVLNTLLTIIVVFWVNYSSPWCLACRFLSWAIIPSQKQWWQLAGIEHGGGAEDKMDVTSREICDFPGSPTESTAAVKNSETSVARSQSTPDLLAKVETCTNRIWNHDMQLWGLHVSVQCHCRCCSMYHSCQPPADALEAHVCSGNWTKPQSIVTKMKHMRKDF